MGSKRGIERIESLQAKLYAGMAAQRARRARPPTTSTRKIQAFANFGFAESHSLSLRAARLRVARGSSCTTRRRSSPRCCAPSRWGSTRRPRWSPTPAATASRCGGPTCTSSGVDAVLEPVEADELRAGSSSPDPADPGSSPDPTDRGSNSPRPGQPGPAVRPPTGPASCLDRHQPPVGEFDPTTPDAHHDAPQGYSLRGAARSRRRPRDRACGGRTGRRRTGRERAVPLDGGPRSAHRAGRGTPRGAGDGGGAGVSRPDPAAGFVACRERGAGRAGFAAGHPG